VGAARDGSFMPPNSCLAAAPSAEAAPVVAATSPAVSARPFARALKPLPNIIVMPSSAPSGIVRLVRVICRDDTLERDFGESVLSGTLIAPCMRPVCFLPRFGLLFFGYTKNEG
jgi:hypothetical protein